jgi:hypothetical protein
MSVRSQSKRRDRAKVTIDCTINERAYIKMLAARAHMNLSEFILSYLRKDFPQDSPNEETMESIQELREGRGVKCDSIEDFWNKMGMNPRA